VASDEWRPINSLKELGKNTYTENAEGAEKREERSGKTGAATRARGGNIEERFLAAQADRFAGANRCRKTGLLRSE
jgi:hypothetical protein